MSRFIYLLAPIIAWAVSQSIKVILDKLRGEKLTFDDFVSSGNMPSAHVSGPTAFLVVYGHNQGYDNPVFAIAFMFTVLVAYDSLGVRRTAAESANAIKKMGRKLSIEIGPLHIYRGHTPFEVLAGVVVGIIIGTLLLILL